MSKISRSTITIRLFGKTLDPAHVTEKLGALPTSSAKTGERIIKGNGKERVVKKGFWRFEYGESDDVILEDKITLLLDKLTDDPGAWKDALQGLDLADLFCGLFIDNLNEGFSLTPSIMKKLSDRGLEISFDIYSPTETWRESPED